MVKTILSIQSAVAYGFAGNSAAVFPIRRMGLDVWPVYTVTFSANTVYGPPHGPLMTPEQVSEVVAGIAELGELSNVDAVLSGYLGEAGIAHSIADAVDLTREYNPQAIYLCDPVMGDIDRGFYSMPGIPEFIRDELVPRATFLTPNLFELRALVNRQVDGVKEIVAAAQELLAKGPQAVVVTSAVSSEDELAMIAVNAEGAWEVTTPMLNRKFEGSGDLTSAVLLSNLLSGASLDEALAATANSVYGVLSGTKERRELDLVGTQDELVNPTNNFAARQIS